jgi:hypothetical protein
MIATSRKRARALRRGATFLLVASLGVWGLSLVWSARWVSPRSTGGLHAEFNPGWIDLRNFYSYGLVVEPGWYHGWGAWWNHHLFVLPALRTGALDDGSLGWYAIVPHWFLAASAAMLTAGSHLLVLRQRRLDSEGCCARCGYDLSGLSGACPECGTARAHPRKALP